MIYSYLLKNINLKLINEIDGLHKNFNLLTRVLYDANLSNQSLYNQKKIYHQLNCQSFIIHLDINVPANKNKFMWTTLIDQICFALDSIADQNVLKINLNFLPEIILKSPDDYRKHLTDLIASVIEKLQLKPGLLNIQHFEDVALFDQSVLCVKDLYNTFQCKLTLEPATFYRQNIELLKQEGKWAYISDMVLLNDFSVFTNKEVFPGEGITPHSSIIDVINSKQEEAYLLFAPKGLSQSDRKLTENYFDKCDEYFLKHLKKLE